VKCAGVSTTTKCRPRHQRSGQVPGQTGHEMFSHRTGNTDHAGELAAMRSRVRLAESERDALRARVANLEQEREVTQDALRRLQVQLATAERMD
jgi:hypothetical protein